MSHRPEVIQRTLFQNPRFQNTLPDSIIYNPLELATAWVDGYADLFLFQGNPSLPLERHTAKYVIISSWGNRLLGLVVYFLYSFQLPLPGWVCPPPPHLVCS